MAHVMDEQTRTTRTEPLCEGDVNTLRGYAHIMRLRGEVDMPLYFDGLADAIERERDTTRRK